MIIPTWFVVSTELRAKLLIALIPITRLPRAKTATSISEAALHKGCTFLIAVVVIRRQVAHLIETDKPCSTAPTLYFARDTFVLGACFLISKVGRAGFHQTDTAAPIKSALHPMYYSLRYLQFSGLAGCPYYEQISTQGESSDASLILVH